MHLFEFGALRSALTASLALLAIPFLASCGGSGGGNANGEGTGIDESDPTITTYAPQTLNRVQLDIGDGGTGGTATFVFTSGSRQSPETEIGTFEYTNLQDNDIFVDEITNGTYHYRVITPVRGILTLTGGNVVPGPNNPTVFGNLGNMQNDLDFSGNAGSTSSFVVVSIGRRTPSFFVDALVSVDGAPLPLNYGGTPDTREDDPNVASTLDGRTYSFPDEFGMTQQLTFAADSQIGNREDGTFTGDLEGTYQYVADLTGDAPSALRLFIETIDEDGETEFQFATLFLTFTTPTNGSFVSLTPPFRTGGNTKSFIIN